MTGAHAPVIQRKEWFGHPRFLWNLFGVEMWERFSFYGMQGILLIYLYYGAASGGLGLDIAVASSIVGAYGSALYFATIAGAWVSDRLLGPDRTLFYSGVLVVVGHLALAVVPDLLGVGVGLLCIALGGGGVKASSVASVGLLYGVDDPKRDAGFSIFYMGINIGAFVGPIATGLTQRIGGFHVGFALATVGMAIGLVQYRVGRSGRSDGSEAPCRPLTPRQSLRTLAVTAVGVAVAAWVIVSGILPMRQLSTAMVFFSIVTTVALFGVMLLSRDVTPTERTRVVYFIPMFFVSAAFWAICMQQFTTITTFSDQSLDRNVFGFEIPVGWVQSFNPIFIVVFSVVVAAIWTKLGSRQPAADTKMSIGAVVAGSAFLILPLIATGTPNSAPLLMLMLILFLVAAGELLIGPVGLSLATAVAPKPFRAQMVALYYLSMSLGTALSGTFAGFYTQDNQRVYFASVGVLAILVAIGGWLVARLLESRVARPRPSVPAEASDASYPLMNT